MMRAAVIIGATVAIAVLSGCRSHADREQPLTRIFAVVDPTCDIQVAPRLGSQLSSRKEVISADYDVVMGGAGGRRMVGVSIDLYGHDNVEPGSDDLDPLRRKFVVRCACDDAVLWVSEVIELPWPPPGPDGGGVEDAYELRITDMDGAEGATMELIHPDGHTRVAWTSTTDESRTSIPVASTVPYETDTPQVRTSAGPVGDAVYDQFQARCNKELVIVSVFGPAERVGMTW